jgi:MFS family permease
MKRGVMIGAGIALAAASAGVVIPSMRALATAHGGGAAVTGALVAAHVLGGIGGAALGPRLARRHGARRLVAAAFAASCAITAALALAPGVAALIVGRALDGACHLLGVTALLAAGVTGDPARRARTAGWLGMVLVLGVGAGIGAGGAVPASAALLVAAALTAAALVCAVPALDDAVPPARHAAVRARDVVAPPALIAAGERFVFGLLSVTMPFAMTARRTGMILGCFMLASVVVMPWARRAAQRGSARQLACRAATVLAAALALAGVDGVLAGPAALAWAIVGGAAAGGLYASTLALVAAHERVDDRLAAMAAVHAAGNAGHALGALGAGAALTLVAPHVVVAFAGAGVVSLGVAAAARQLRPAPVLARATLRP